MIHRSEYQVRDGKDEGGKEPKPSFEMFYSLFHYEEIYEWKKARKNKNRSLIFCIEREERHPYYHVKVGSILGFVISKKEVVDE